MGKLLINKYIDWLAMRYPNSAAYFNIAKIGFAKEAYNWVVLKANSKKELLEDRIINMVEKRGTRATIFMHLNDFKKSLSRRSMEPLL